ncbi:MAG: hypothetical protein ACM3IJ_00315 [Candidatus Levyibacteriota bacterium]
MIKHNKEKRDSLIQENSVLRETIKGLQEENGNLTANNHDLDKKNAILNERLSNFGIRDFFKTLGSLGLGAAIGNLQNNQFAWAAVIGIISGVLLLFFSVYDKISTKEIEVKEKVGDKF